MALGALPQNVPRTVHSLARMIDDVWHAAGARSTLLSLWKVDDQATYGFMKRYYELLKQGKGRMEALLAVQQIFRTNPDLVRWKDPRYWAAWQLVGETGPIPGI